MKLSRNAHLMYVAGGSADYQIVGKDIQELSVEMNGTFETNQNILGDTIVTDAGYAPSVSVDPYYADKGDKIYSFLKNLALNRLSGDEAKGKMLEVIVEDTEAAKHEAWEQECVFEIVSYGGDTNGFRILYNVHPSGKRTNGNATIDKETREVTFTKSTSLS